MTRLHTQVTFITISIGVMMATIMITHAHAAWPVGGVDKEGSWYPGEGLQQGDYFSYSLCHINYRECSEFRMDFWIAGDVQSADKAGWLAEAVVYDKNMIMSGRMHLIKTTSEPARASPDLDVYARAFEQSIVWFSRHTTAEAHPYGGPQEFSAPTWQALICEPGCEQPAPRAIENITVAGKIWETIRMDWAANWGDDPAVNRVWIVDEFPFPIRARAHVFVGFEEHSPVEYEFVLLDYGRNVQENPFADVASSNLHERDMEIARGCEADFKTDTLVTKPTINGKYYVHVSYGPENPKQHCKMSWYIEFADRDDRTKVLGNVPFDVLVSNWDGTYTRSLAAEQGRDFLYSALGQYGLDIRIREGPGPVNYVLLVYDAAPTRMVLPGSDDYATIPIRIYEHNAITVESSSLRPDTCIPEWMRTSAGWWAEDRIDDYTFVSGIQYLMNRGLICDMPADSAGADTALDVIPDWAKANAGWWAEDRIDDDTFALVVQFMIRHGMITVT